MADLYDDDKLPLEAQINGDLELAKKIKDVEFIVTVIKGVTAKDEAPVKVPITLEMPPIATYQYKPETVPDGLDNYDVKYKASMQVPDQKSPTVAPGKQDFKIWPHESEIEFTADEAEHKKKVEFVVVGGSRSEVKTSEEDGSFKARLAKETYTVELEAPWCFDGDPTHKGRKRSYKVKKNPYKVEFVAPKVEDPKTKTKQYVNLATDSGGWSKDKPFGHQIEFTVGAEGDTERSENKLGKENDVVFIEVEFTPKTKRNKPQPKLLDDGLDDKAAGSNENKTWKGKIKLGANGQATFKVELGYAGGDVVEVKVGADDSCRDASLEFETWRRLYYELMYCEILAGELAEGSKGKTLSSGIMSKVKARLDAVFIEYEHVASHEYKKSEAPKGTIVEGDFIEAPGRERVICGGGLPELSGSFTSTDKLTNKITVVERAFSSTVVTTPEKVKAKKSPHRFHKYGDAFIPLAITPKTWKAKIDKRADRKSLTKPKIKVNISDAPMPAKRDLVYTIKVSATGASTTVTYKYGSDKGELAQAASRSEFNKLEAFFKGELSPEIVKPEKRGKVDVEIEGPDADGRRGFVKQEVEEQFGYAAANLKFHPGLDARGRPRTGTVDASWFSSPRYDFVDITLPTGTGDQPGDFIGSLSKSSCPIEIEFEIKTTYRISGMYYEGKQLFTLRPGKDQGALASTMCHELGHAMGMTIIDEQSDVPPGTDPAKHVDNGGTYYVEGSSPFTDGKRDVGVGEHCATGIDGSDLADPKFKDKQGTCIMFHSSSDKDDKPNYCETCTGYIQARKLTDIVSYWDERSEEDY